MHSHRKKSRTRFDFRLLNCESAAGEPVVRDSAVDDIAADDSTTEPPKSYSDYDGVRTHRKERAHLIQSSGRHR